MVNREGNTVHLRRVFLGAALALAAGTLSAAPATHTKAAAITPAIGSGPLVKARATEPVVITGSQIPSWSRLAAQGNPAPYPSGVSSTQTGGVIGDGVRSAHNGIFTVPPDARTGVNPDQIAAYRWDGSAWSEVPVQVDQMYVHFLANAHSSFSFYSGTSYELSYAWNPTAHSVGEESWKKVFGGTPTIDTGCTARYQAPGASGQAELAYAEIKHSGENFAAVSQPVFAGVAQDDYTQAMQDPVNTAAGKPELNDDDQIALMAGDAGLQAPAGTAQPAGTFPNNGQQITVVDPTAPADGSAATSYLYLFLQPTGSSFNSQNGYVRMARDTNADEWIDRDSFTKYSLEQLGVGNQNYGPNIPGIVCRTATNNPDGLTTADGLPRFSNDRQPRDGMTITTPTYTVYASGRWMVRQLRVTAPGTTNNYGPNLISRWKGRAFQSSPDSSISVVGFEDEQVNWELNSTLLGWKVGPVRAIREIWGADSGTNVTKTELYYRDAYDFSYHVRVHPIPTDGLYTSWDYRYGIDTTYYNQKNEQGIPINGNTPSAGEINQIPVTGQPAFFNTRDPTQDICNAIDNPEEIAGPSGALVYISDITGPTSLGQPFVVPYYYDNACFDDGTGDGPVPRADPGDASNDPNVQAGYVAYWKAHGAPSTLQYSDLKCQPAQVGQPGVPAWQIMPFQGAIGESGLHFFFTNDSDHRIDEIDAEQWVYTVPVSAPRNLISAAASAPGEDYGLNVVAPLQTTVVPYSASAPTGVPDAPLVGLLPLAALGAALPLLRARRRAGARHSAN